mgnify:CR=1 FL=1
MTSSAPKPSIGTGDGGTQQPDASQPESFTAFKNSFAYGSRTDLLFKFLKALPDDEAADFFKELLLKVGATLDDGDWSRLAEHIYAYNERSYAGPGQFAYDDGPFAPMTKPLKDSRLGLLTTTGHFVEGDKPEMLGEKDMSQEEAVRRIQDFLRAPPTLSMIPCDTPRENLRVVHGGYDTRAVQADPNVALPLERLRELAATGLFGELAPEAFSFTGACAQLPLRNKLAPQWAEILKERQIDAMLLVPV